MAAKKYLSLEEAAQLLGVRPDEVMRLREKGDLRGFADRGTWKFKSDDVEEAKRRRQPDSNPDVPLMTDEDDSALSEPPRRRGSNSDSDVRLVLDDDLKSQLTGSSGDVPVFPAKKGSDSDVRLVGASDKIKKKSDSDVKLIKAKGADSGMKLSDSDSDVRLTAPAGSLSDSDSDVRLSAPLGSDSDVKLVDPNSAKPSGGLDLDLNFNDSVLSDEDSGIALHSGNSSLRLSGESGIQLRRPQDSGILLEGSSAGSGFLLADEETFQLADSGIKKKDSGSQAKPILSSLSDDDLSSAPLLLSPDSDSDRTDPEVPLMLDDDEDDLMPKSFSGSDTTQAETNVILFDEDEEAAPTIRQRKQSASLSSKELDTATFEMDVEEGLSDEVLEASDDSFSDESLDEVFEDDESFEDSFSDEGVSAADFSTSRAGMPVALQPEWSGKTVALLACSTVFLSVGAWMACDLLGSVFAASGPSYPGPLVEAVGGLFK